MGTVKIYRYTSASDTTSTAEFITLDSSGDPNTSIGIIDKNSGGIEIVPVDAIGDNQGAEMEFGDKQALSTFEKTYIIHGVVYQMNGATGASGILGILDKWEKGSKSSIGIFDQGRFGIEIEDDSTKDFLPIPTSESAPQGLLWLDN